VERKRRLAETGSKTDKGLSAEVLAAREAVAAKSKAGAVQDDDIQLTRSLKAPGFKP
jgi:hypothetical protein